MMGLSQTDLSLLTRERWTVGTWNNLSNNDDCYLGARYSDPFMGS